MTKTYVTVNFSLFRHFELALNIQTRPSTKPFNIDLNLKTCYKTHLKQGIDLAEGQPSSQNGWRSTLTLPSSSVSHTLIRFKKTLNCCVQVYFLVSRVIVLYLSISFLVSKTKNIPVRSFATTLLLSNIAVELFFAFFDVISSFTEKITILCFQ